MRTKIFKIFIVFLFALTFTLEISKAEPVYYPSVKSLGYIAIGWIVEPTWIEDHWFIHAYDPYDSIVRWEDYEE